MKTVPLTIVLAIAVIGSAFGQAPSSVGNLTLRTAYQNGDDIPTTYLESVSFSPNGTFIANLSVQAGMLISSYQDVVGGTYHYAQTSPSTATITFSQSLPPLTLNFTSSSEGSLSGYPPPSLFSLTPTGGARSARALINMSTLISAKQGSPVTFGFVIGGTVPWREILVRAVGPGLSQFGVNNFAVNPVYQINAPYQQSGGFDVPTAPGESWYGTGWSATAASTATLSAENARAGAFPFAQGSNDKADIFLLSPGAYTITVNPIGPSGEGSELIEVYEVE